MWIVAERGTVNREDWRNIGTTQREPSEELAASLLRQGSHTPRYDDDLYAPEGDGIEVRFLPIGGGEPVVFICRYEMTVRQVTVEEADAEALPDLDAPEYEPMGH